MRRALFTLLGLSLVLLGGSASAGIAANGLSLQNGLVLANGTDTGALNLDGVILPDVAE